MLKIAVFYKNRDKRKSPEIIGFQGFTKGWKDFLAVWTGLEPATPCVTGRYSNQLNYHTIFQNVCLAACFRATKIGINSFPANPPAKKSQKKLRR